MGRFFVKVHTACTKGASDATDVFPFSMTNRTDVSAQAFSAFHHQ
jgi:hypothetical protein